MFLWRNKKNINTFWKKKTSYLELCYYKQNMPQQFNHAIFWLCLIYPFFSAISSFSERKDPLRPVLQTGKHGYNTTRSVDCYTLFPERKKNRQKL